MRYGKELKNHILKRVLPPQGESIERVAREEGLSEQTIRNWKKQALSNNYVPSTEENVESDKWTSQDKFLMVLETSHMSEADLGEYARQKGVYVEQIATWKDACLNANGGLAKMAARLKLEIKEKDKEIKTIRRELERKERALAEAAALLILSKKASAIWNEKEDV